MQQPDSNTPEVSHSDSHTPGTPDPLPGEPGLWSNNLPVGAINEAAESSGATAAIPPAATPLPAQPGVWKAWPTVGLGVAIFLVNGMFQSLIMLVFAIDLAIGGLSFSDPFSVEQMIYDLLSDGRMLSLAIIVSSLAGIAITLLFIRIRHGPSIVDYLGLKPIGWKTFIVLIGVFAALVLVSLGFNQVVDSSQEGDIFSRAYQNTAWPALFWIALIIVGPVFEEILFRGFLFAGLRQSALGITGTIVLTGFFFAVLHAAQYNAFVIAQIFVLGIVFGVVRWRTGSLWSSIFLHGLWNFGQMLFLTLWPALGG